jgi:UDP-glucose 4-epimerase
VTKAAAEDVCKLFHRNQGLACMILRTSRFFPEEDDDSAVRAEYSDGNVKDNEFLYRRVDIDDVVSAHLLAAQKAPSIAFGKYIISATSRFRPADLADLPVDAPGIVRKYCPEYEAEYERRGWRMFPTIGRVYVNERARTELGWRPQYDFNRIIRTLAAGEDPGSPLARLGGSKGYHARSSLKAPTRSTSPAAAMCEETAKVKSTPHDERRPYATYLNWRIAIKPFII